MSSSWNIAGVLVRAEGDTGILRRMGGLDGFVSDPGASAGLPDLVLKMCCAPAPASSLDHYLSQSTDLYRIEYFWRGNVTEIDFHSDEGAGPVCHCSYDDSTRTASVSFSETAVGAVRFAFWEVFGFAAVVRGIAPIHSAAVVCGEEAFLFLGGSGAGKSTQAALWVQNVAGTSLLNDDSPVINAEGSQIRAYGSPWGGKTPLFINRNYPVRSFVRVQKSGKNRISTLALIQKVAALLPSFSLALRMHPRFAARLQKLTLALAERAEAILFDCLPEPSAALLCHDYLIETKKHAI